MARPVWPKSEAGSAERFGVPGQGMFPFQQLGVWRRAVSSPVGYRAKPRRFGDSERFIGLYKVASGVDFADVKFTSVKFSWASEPQKTRTTNSLWGSGPLDLCVIGDYAADRLDGGRLSAERY